MKLVLLLIAAVCWALVAIDFKLGNLSLIWAGAALIVAGFALEGVVPWRKGP